MNIHEIRKTMDKAACRLEGEGWTITADELWEAEKEVEEQVGIFWTLGDNLAKALEEVLAECAIIEGELGINPIANKARKALEEWRKHNE